MEFTSSINYSTEHEDTNCWCQEWETLQSLRWQGKGDILSLIRDGLDQFLGRHKLQVTEGGELDDLHSP